MISEMGRAKNLFTSHVTRKRRTLILQRQFAECPYCERRPSPRCCRSVGLLERLQLQIESGHSMLFEIRKPECVL
jgi:hypothetical protein